MRVSNGFVFFVIVLLLAGTALADFVPLRNDVIGDQPETVLLSSDAARVEFEVKIPGIERLEGTLEGQIWDRFEIPGGGVSAELGSPEVPTFSRMIAIPANKAVRVEFEPFEVTTLSNIHLIPAQGKDIEEVQQSKEPIRFSASAYESDTFSPKMQASASDPAVMRGVRLVSINTRPVQYNPVTKELKIANRYKVTVYFEGSDERNNPQTAPRPMSRSWVKLMQHLVVNFDELDLEIVPVGDYLIVCKNDANLLNNVLPPFVDWKKRKGHNVTLITYNGTPTNYQVKALIQNEYDNAEIPPEFVLLFGDVDGNYALPGWPTVGYPTDQTDQEYSLLEGGDILADVAVGRMPADDDYEARTLVNKVLYYEKMPYITSTDWYHQGCVVAGNSAAGISTVQLNRYIKTRMIEHEFTRVDTFWYWMSSGSVYNTTTTAINNGISCYNYRGNYEMQNFNVGDIDYLTNTFKLPFVVTVTCGTGGFAGSESFMEHFAVVGSPYAPKAAIAAVGTASWETHTRFNNTIVYGIWSAIFDEGITEAGNALNRGKLELYNTFIDHDQSWAVSDFSEYAALAGDPGVDIFNGPIQFMTSDLPDSKSWGENTLTLTVNRTGVGPLADALVCYYKENDMHEVGLTDANGQVTLPLNLASAGNVKVTVTQNNFHPIVDSLNIIQTDVTVGFYSNTIDDDGSGTSSGDGDGILNPSETVEIPLTFKNYGSSTPASSVSVTASSNDEYVTLIDNVETFPNMAPGATQNSLDDFDLTVAPDCPDGHTIHLTLTTTSAQGTWEGGMDLDVVSSAINYRGITVGTDTVLTIGAASNMVVNIVNDGGKTATSLIGELTSLDPLVTVNDNNASFGSVAAGATANCSSNPFSVTASDNSPPGFRAQLQIAYTTASGSVETDTIEVSLGVKTSVDPQGPDSYGYYCYDNTDLMYAQAPVYNWVEIDPSYGGSGNQLAIYDNGENDDMSIMVQLPFTFRYYGEDVNSLTVCSNGWIATNANESYSDFRNYRIPSIVGPPGMIAPFWDDLVTDPGRVYAYNDAANHRFIIQWSRMECGYGWGSHPQETFQVILFDPVYYPTPTGDGEILFQYNHIEQYSGDSSDIPYSTVGIENLDQTDGIEITYWASYDDPAASQLADGRAYLFTTAFDYNAGGEMEVDLTYVSGSPVPVGGGNVYFDIYVANSTGQSQDYDAWLDVTYEGGSPTTIILRNFTSFQPGWTINRPNTYFPVPAAYAAGNYMMYGRVGIYPNAIWNEDSFPFVKSGSSSTEPFTPFVPAGVPDPFEVITMNDNPIALPSEFAIDGPYPNPFNPTATIGFALPEASLVKLEIYDVSGRLVKTLIDGTRSAGNHSVTFNADGLASGLYIYRLQAGQHTASGKMVLMK